MSGHYSYAIRALAELSAPPVTPCGAMPAWASPLTEACDLMDEVGDDLISVKSEACEVAS